MNTQKGFTLIELMIVIAIIGIFAALAITAYTDYTARAQMSEALTLAAGQKGYITEEHAATGSYPTATSSVASGKYVSEVTIDNGVIKAEMGTTNINSKISGAVLELSPTQSNGSYTWVCSTSDSKHSDFIPSSCE